MDTRLKQDIVFVRKLSGAIRLELNLNMLCLLYFLRLSSKCEELQNDCTECVKNSPLASNCNIEQESVFGNG